MLKQSVQNFLFSTDFGITLLQSLKFNILDVLKTCSSVHDIVMECGRSFPHLKVNSNRAPQPPIMPPMVWASKQLLRYGHHVKFSDFKVSHRLVQIHYCHGSIHLCHCASLHDPTKHGEFIVTLCHKYIAIPFSGRFFLRSECYLCPGLHSMDYYKFHLCFWQKEAPATIFLLSKNCHGRHLPKMSDISLLTIDINCTDWMGISLGISSVMV